MLTGSAEKTLDTLKQILDDIELVAGKGTCMKLLANIKNTMSDRHIVQKNFNDLLESYRSEILPDIQLLLRGVGRRDSKGSKGSGEPPFRLGLFKNR